MRPPPEFPPKLDGIDLSEDARIKLAWVFAVHAGRETAEDACAEMGISAEEFTALTDAALGGAEAAMERAVADELQQRTEELEQEAASLRRSTNRALRKQDSTGSRSRSARDTGWRRRRR